MTPPISDFFDIDLIEEQHKWTIPQMAFFYRATEEEVRKALRRANDKLRDNPLSLNYTDPDSNDNGCSSDQLPTQPCGALLRDPGEGGVEGCEGLASGGSSP